MKTQFSDLVKIAKNKLQTLERELGSIKAEIEKTNEMIIQKEAEIIKIEYPISGVFSILQQYNIAMHNMKNEIEDLKHKKLNLSDKIGNIHKKMIEANREIEKFKYLESEVLEAYRIELQKAEAKELDEIAVMLFKSKNNI